MPFITSENRLVPIVVVRAAAPEAALPNVPTFKEVGLEPVNRLAYYGILRPQGPAEGDCRQGACAGVKSRRVQDPAVRRRIEDTGSLIIGQQARRSSRRRSRPSTRSTRRSSKKRPSSSWTRWPASLATRNKPPAFPGGFFFCYLAAHDRSRHRTHSRDRRIHRRPVAGGGPVRSNTLAAYRRDLTLFAQWLRQQARRPPRSKPTHRARPERLHGRAPVHANAARPALGQPPSDRLQALLSVGVCASAASWPTVDHHACMPARPSMPLRGAQDAERRRKWTALLDAPDVGARHWACAIARCWS
jgi:hypothetical protein